MGGSYRQCTECGKRALSIATRCPGCGRELTEPVARETGGSTLDLRRVLSPPVAAALVAVVLLAAAFLTRGDRAEVRTTLAGRDSVGAGVEVAVALDSASAAATAAEDGGALLVARTWTHVRGVRRRGGDVEAVLLPGDTVVADSLRNGWYRVALEGEVLGYAHHSTLQP